MSSTGTAAPRLQALGRGQRSAALLFADDVVVLVRNETIQR